MLLDCAVAACTESSFAASDKNAITTALAGATGWLRDISPACDTSAVAAEVTFANRSVKRLLSSYTMLHTNDLLAKSFGKSAFTEDRGRESQVFRKWNDFDFLEEGNHS